MRPIWLEGMLLIIQAWRGGADSIECCTGFLRDWVPIVRSFERSGEPLLVTGVATVHHDRGAVGTTIEVAFCFGALPECLAVGHLPRGSHLVARR